MKKYLIGIAILGGATTLFGYALMHGTPAWLRIAAQLGVAFFLILGSVYTIVPPKDGRIRSGRFIVFRQVGNVGFSMSLWSEARSQRRQSEASAFSNAV